MILPSLAILLQLAFIVEAIVEFLKPWIPDKFELSPAGTRIISFLVSLPVTFALSGLSSPLACVATALIVSRGSNYIHDTFKRVSQ